MRCEDRTGVLRATGIVLAGGRSQRFGRDKLMEDIDGEPLVHRAIRALHAVCDEVIVSIGDESPPLPQDLDLVVVRDRVNAQGPLAGLSAALGEVETDLAVIVGGDMPNVSPAVLELMLAALGEDEDVEIVALQDGGKVRPLPCVLRASPATAKVGTLVDSGERRLRALLSELRVAAVPESAWRTLDPDGGSLRDIDSPGDLVLCLRNNLVDCVYVSDDRSGAASDQRTTI